jgi:hypothetical protein
MLIWASEGGSADAGPQQKSVPRGAGGARNDATSSFSIPEMVCMLLKKIGRAKWGTRYPKMCMIMNGLAANLDNATFYFQRDNLWKKLKNLSSAELPHDMYDPKRVNG